MPALSNAEKVELAAIPACAVLAWVLAPRDGLKLEIGAALAAAALVLLLQGFVRDLWLLRAARRQKPAASAHTARCMCVESAIGLTVIVAGVVLAGFGLARAVQLSPPVLGAAVGAIMLTSYLLKDFVFEWSPWKIRREKNHAQVIFRWRA